MLKRIRIISRALAVALLAAAIAACSPAINAGASVATGATGATGDRGTIAVSFPSPGDRGLVDLAFAKANCDYFELIAYNKDNFYCMKSLASTGGSVTVAVGTYNVVVLGGQTTSTTGFYQLYASAYFKGVVVDANSTSPVGLLLTNATFNFTVPSSAYLGASYAVSASGDTGSPMIAVNSCNFFAEGHNLSGSEYTIAANTMGVRNWNIAVSFIAPSAAGSRTIGWSSGAVCLIDSDYLRNDLIGNLGGSYWNTPGLAYSLNTAVTNYCSQTITFSPPPPTQITATVGWGSGQ
jgi:hypothetical protein